MKNRFFTILIVPEKSSGVRRFVIPAWLVRGAAVGAILLFAFMGIMIVDYRFVMGQLSENQDLKIENRRLRQQVQVYKNRMGTIEGTLDRIRTFATRLRVITNLEDRGSLIESIKSGKATLPDASANIASAPTASPSPSLLNASELLSKASEKAENALREVLPTENPEETQLKKDADLLDSQFGSLEGNSVDIERLLQDLYERLADQKSFLAALPTRKPAVGYFTSGFGVRRSPYGGYDKMHEGLDIANFPGTTIQATADGTVVFAESKAGYGQTAVIDHGYGLETWYGHARKLLVRKGQKVRRGEAIAQLGNSGRSTGPHVHYEVRVNGLPVDPLPYILEN